jgi:murein DD-endopeptidase MepM/ murein hydrolase activator NlpD
MQRPELGEMPRLGVGAKSASKGSDDMTGTLVERLWTWLHATFPERQIYIRSDGRVQFFTFGPTLQATLSGLALIFLGWVAFASVNVIFKDRIIASKDRRYQQMQSAYENRVADLQLSYDELNGALVTAEDRFKAIADELESKQDTVSHLLQRKQAVDAIIDSMGDRNPAATVKARDSDIILRAPGTGMSSDSVSGDIDSGVRIVLPQGAAALPTAPQPQSAHPNKASFLDDTVSRFAAIFLHPAERSAYRPPPNEPALRILAFQTARIARLGNAETALLVGVDTEIGSRIAGVQAVLRRVGVDPNGLERQASDGEGGPLIPIQAVHIDGISDSGFTAAYAGASAHVKELDTLLGALQHVPLTTPVHGAQFELTSDFGPRVDPFTRHIAFHPGLDFGGPWGAVVCATAPGTVVWAGQRGGYGNMVEIDHGYGFHTRYAHLSAVLVKVGAVLSKGAPVGKLGSTGRSTGPHVHYEVWLADTVRDPSRFIEAGHHVFQ